MFPHCVNQVTSFPDKLIFNGITQLEAALQLHQMDAGGTSSEPDQSSSYLWDLLS
jgi:hypothetical protein